MSPSLAASPFLLVLLTSSAAAEVVAPPAAWLPRVRVPLLVLALALLAAAVIVELWSFRSRPT